MPETIENENLVVPPARRRASERTEAKFFEDVDKIISEAERLGAEYDPPNAIAKLAQLKPKRAAALAARAADQTNAAVEENARNSRENLYQSLGKEITKLVGYAKSAGKAANEVAALQSIARTIKGVRAQPIDPSQPTTSHNSVANLSYASRADNYAEFIEQYDALAIPTDEEMYKAATHRDQLAALRTANNAVLQAESEGNTSREQLDNLAYLDNDTLLNACISAKTYIKSKYGATGQPYKNIAKTRLIMPSRLR